MLFKDREDAAKKLLQKLMHYKNDPNVLVLGLPRGGIAVAAPIAKALKVLLDILVARKLGFPGEPELAFGAISEDGYVFFDQELIDYLNISETTKREVIEQEKKEAARRASVYRKGKSRIGLHDKIVILIDDGIATGATMIASIASARAQNPKKIIVAIPVGPHNACSKIKKLVDELVCLETPSYFPGISAFYAKFDQLNDEDVIRLLT